MEHQTLRGILVWLITLHNGLMRFQSAVTEISQETETTNHVEFSYLRYLSQTGHKPDALAKFFCKTTMFHGRGEKFLL